MEDLQIKKCRQENCKVSIDGKCLESLDLDTCPHFYFEDKPDIVDIEENQDESEDRLTKLNEKKVALFTGQALAVENIQLISNQYFCQKIFILGESGSGKTTLIATIFDLFQKNTINDLQFAGSLTQIGFEERCHLARFNSEAVVPATEKTKSPEFDFLHLAIKKNSSEENIHLLLSDISGEKLKSASSSSMAIRELKLMEQADKIVIVLDGAKVSNKFERPAVLFQAENLIQRAIDEKIFNKKTDINIVLSKWDIFAEDGNFNFQNIIEIPFSKKFGDKVGILKFSQLASRPEINFDKIPLGYGIYNLITDWMTLCEEMPEINKIYKELENERWFNKFSRIN